MYNTKKINCFRSDDSHEYNSNNTTNKYRKRKNESVESKTIKQAKTNEENGPVEQGKTLLEILELEMRARAIRALLKQSGSDKENEQGHETVNPDDLKNGVKETTDEIVDLTGCEDEDLATSSKKETFENNDLDEKLEQSKNNKKVVKTENDKSKRLQAELELRNKLFKRKIYRTRQQRMENEEEKINENFSDENSEIKKKEIECPSVKIKEEPVEVTEILVEDPEEGEISTSEDEYPVEIKQEKLQPESFEILEQQNSFESKIDENSERVTAIDNGTFVNNCNLEYPPEIVQENVEGDKSEEVLTTTSDVVSQNNNKETDSKNPDDCTPNKEENTESESVPEETSWRHRWLQKDGVQKLVKSSKIFAKVKKRIAEKSHKAKEETITTQEINSCKNNNKVEVIEGSIEEYEKLLGKTQEQKKDSSVIIVVVGVVVVL